MSTTDKYSIKEHHEEIYDDNNKGAKNTDEIPIDEIHTVNDWEHADLGDEQRKQKFLRLMGAKKHKDDSRIDTHHDDGKKHSRSKIQNETISRELEKQFNEGLQAKILHAEHEGLGFHGNESTSTTDHPPQFVHATTNAQSSKPDKFDS